MKPKQWQNIFHVIVNANSVVQHVIQIKNGIIDYVIVNVKIVVSIKKNIVGILNVTDTSKSVADTSVTECGEIIIVMNNSSTKNTNTITPNVTKTSSINCLSTKVRDCYVLHKVLWSIILLLIITIAIIMQNKKV